MIIALLSLIVCWVGLVWGIVCLCSRICGKRRLLRPKKKPARYSLLQPEAEDDSSACTFRPSFRSRSIHTGSYEKIV